MSYTTEDLVEDFIGRDLEASEVTLLEVVLIPAVKQFIDRYTSTTFDLAEPSTRYYDAECGNIIDIDPCSSVTEVAFVDQELDTVETLDTDTFSLYPLNDEIKTYIKLRFRASAGIAKVKVTGIFSSAIGEVPADIMLVATHICGGILNSRTNQGVKSETIEGHSITYDLERIAMEDPTIKQALDMRRPVLI